MVFIAVASSGVNESQPLGIGADLGDVDRLADLRLADVVTARAVLLVDRPARRSPARR